MAQEVSIKVREATLLDYEAVMDINRRIYDGTDYLPALYWELMHRPNSNCFVGVIDGKVVGFINNVVLEEGTAAMTVSVRLHPDYQGHKIMETISDEAMRLTRERHPRLQVVWFASVLTPYYQSQLEQPNNRLLRKKVNLHYSIDGKSLRGLLVTTSSSTRSRVKILGYEESLRILSDPRVVSFFRQDERVVAYVPWTPLKPTIANLQDIARTHTVAFCEEPTSISFGYVHVCSHGFVYHTFCYAVEGIEDLLEHIWCHLHHIKEITSENTSKVYLSLDFPLYINKDEVKEILAPKMGFPLKSKAFRSEYNLVLEHRLSKDDQ